LNRSIRSSFAWALERALRYAIGTCVIAIVLATALSGAAAEQFATSAYLAAFFAALALLFGRIVGRASEEPDAAIPVFPPFFTFSIAVTLILAVVVPLVSQPGAEALVVAGSLALVAAVALVRSGVALSALSFVKRGIAALTPIRDVVGVGVCLLLVAAFLRGAPADQAAALAYALMIVAALLLAETLIGWARLLRWLRLRYARANEVLDEAGAQVGRRAARCAAIVAAIALAAASLSPHRGAEAFAFAAFFAAACAAFGVAIACWRRSAH